MCRRSVYGLNGTLCISLFSAHVSVGCDLDTLLALVLRRYKQHNITGNTLNETAKLLTL
jgi:hypothetical protein